ncbi:ribonuclease H-like domain-containing protein [Tanacetum coccineum]
MLVIAAFHGYEIWQMDVKTAFLNENLTEDDLTTTHEMHLKSRVQNPLVDATSASPMVLLAKSNISARRGPSLEKVNNPYWSFAKGSCRFGDACKYLHNGVHIIAWFFWGVQYENGWVIPTVSDGVTTAGGQLSTAGVQTLSGPPQGVHLVPGTSHPSIQFMTGVQ